MRSRNHLHGPLICTALVLIACSPDEAPEPSAAAVRDSGGVSIVESRNARWTDADAWRLSPEPVLSIGHDTGDPDYLFSTVIGTVLLPDGRIAVADRREREIRLYDSLGTFIGAAGGDGEGPGEYRGIEAMTDYRADSLFVYDLNLRRISILGADGAFSRSVQLPPLQLLFAFAGCALSDGTFLLRSYDPETAQFDRAGYYRQREFVFPFHPGTDDANRVGELPGREGFHVMVQGVPNHGWVPYGKESAMGAFRDGYFLASSDTYELQFFDAQDRLTRIVRRLGAQRPVTADDARAARERIRENWERAADGPHKTAYLRAIPERHVADTVPAFGRVGNPWLWPVILPDDAGNVWVLQYHMDEDEPQQWDVFGPDGAYLGTVEFPLGFTPLDIEGDRVAGVWRDADHVDHVQVYELIKPQ